MALGGWMSGKVFDLTGSYDAAFVNGIAWNALNLAIVLLLMRSSRRHHDTLAVPQRSAV
jgi:cyanate permease